MLLQVCAVLLAVQSAWAQQSHSHPQLQAYLAQQLQQPARQQYRLIPAQPQAQAAQVQQYAAEDDGSSSAQYQQPRAQPQYQLQQLQQPVYRSQQQLGQRLRQPGPVAQEELQQNPEDYDPNPQYQFGFDVKDDQFTNYQNRKEQRDGDKITGSYSVVDSDGFIRTVTYTADPKEGFKAEVTRTPTDIVVKLPTPPPQQLQESHGHGLQRQRQQQYLQAAPEQPQYVRPSSGAYAQPSPAQLQQLQLLAAQQRQHGGQLLRAVPSSSAAAHQNAAAASRAAAAQGYNSQPSGDSVVYQAYQQ